MSMHRRRPEVQKKMIRLLCISIFISLIGITAVSCSDEAPMKAPSAKPADDKAKAVKADAAAKIAPIAPPQQAVVAERLRNPFMPPSIKVSVPVGAVQVPKGPLECCPTTAFSIAMIKTGSDGSSAMLIAPDKKRYIVKVGTRIGNREGKITKIDESGITVKQVVRNEEDKVVSTEDVLIPMPVAKKSSTF